MFSRFRTWVLFMFLVDLLIDLWTVRYSTNTAQKKEGMRNKLTYLCPELNSRSMTGILL